jgi:hypothetical protein
MTNGIVGAHLPDAHEGPDDVSSTWAVAGDWAEASKQSATMRCGPYAPRSRKSAMKPIVCTILPEAHGTIPALRE